MRAQQVGSQGHAEKTDQVSHDEPGANRHAAPDERTPNSPQNPFFGGTSRGCWPGAQLKSLGSQARPRRALRDYAEAAGAAARAEESAAS